VSADARDPSHFDRHAQAYDRSRPGYPPALWSRLRELGVLAPGSRVLEIGAGTGQATSGLCDAGARVTAVEPGPRLAAVLAERRPDVVVVPARVEDAVLAEASYDAVVAATSLHWVDLARTLPRLRRAVVDDGLLAAWWTVFGNPDAPRTPFRDEVDRTVADRVAAGRARGGPAPGRPGPLDEPGWRAALASTGDWVPLHSERFSWSLELDAVRVGDLFSTFSDWSEEEARRVGDWVREHGGTVVEHGATTLHVCAPA